MIKRVRIKPVRIPLFLLVLLTAAAMGFPIFILVTTGFKSASETMISEFSLLPKKWLFENFSRAIGNSDWLHYFGNSAFVTVVVVVLSLVFCSLSGYSFARLRFKGSGFLFMLFLAGLMIPPQAYIVPQYIILRSIPLAGGNNLLGHGGTGWLNTYWALIFPYLAAPVGIFLTKQFYASFPSSLDEAARIDGCNVFDIYRLIYLPMSKPVFATFAILKFSHTWNDFFYPLIMTDTKRLYTVQIALQKFKDVGGVEWNYMMAATLITVLPIMLVFAGAQKYFVQGIVTTGLK